MHDVLTLIVRVQPAANERPWRASLHDPTDGTPRDFESPTALARYLERLSPPPVVSGLR